MKLHLDHIARQVQQEGNRPETENTTRQYSEPTKRTLSGNRLPLTGGLTSLARKLGMAQPSKKKFKQPLKQKRGRNDLFCVMISFEIRYFPNLIEA